MRYEEMRPDAIEAVLRTRPVAYLPWGSHEWHGPQNAIGLDAIKAHHQCLALCAHTGGVVLPPVFCGYQTMKPARGFSHCLEFERGSVTSLVRQYLEQLYDEGFRVMVVVMGHYGGKHVEAVKEGVAAFTERHYLARVWAFPDYEPTAEAGFGGDHAGINETSLLLHFRPDLVDLSLLPADPDGGRLGISATRVLEASAERGAQIAAALVANAVPKIEALLAEVREAHRTRFGSE